MIIVIESSSAGGSAVDTELQRAFVALRVVKIRVLGGGRFRDGTGYVALANDADTAAALAALAHLGDRSVDIASDAVSEARSLTICGGLGRRRALSRFYHPRSLCKEVITTHTLDKAGRGEGFPGSCDRDVLERRREERCVQRLAQRDFPFRPAPRSSQLSLPSVRHHPWLRQSSCFLGHDAQPASLPLNALGFHRRWRTVGRLRSSCAQ
jgi:hypothetical protein